MKTRTDNVEYHKGREDFANGVKFDDNPYPYNPDPDSRWTRWWLGWHDEKAGM